MDSSVPRVSITLTTIMLGGLVLVLYGAYAAVHHHGEAHRMKFHLNLLVMKAEVDTVGCAVMAIGLILILGVLTHLPPNTTVAETLQQTVAVIQERTVDAVAAIRERTADVVAVIHKTTGDAVALVHKTTGDAVVVLKKLLY